MQVKGRGARLADSQFLTLLNTILSNSLFAEAFGPASSCARKDLSQHAGFLLPTGGVWSQPERNPAYLGTRRGLLPFAFLATV